MALVAQVAEMGRLASEEKIAFSFRAEDELSLANSVQDIQNLEDSSIQVIINKAHKFTKKGIKGMSQKDLLNLLRKI